jgi:hypothetical protein
MKEYLNQHFTGERALFMTQGATITGCLFDDGESPLKESSDLTISNTEFGWKYPLWYGKNIRVSHCHFKEMARAGIWYTDQSRFSDCVIEAPKEFRKCHDLTLTNLTFTQAEETLWWNDGVVLQDVKAKGNYFGMGSSHLVISNLTLEGNYPFDGGKDITIEKSHLLSKDAFWNCDNVTIRDSVIEGEYFGWNSSNITLINCTIRSHQGFCYMSKITLIHCQVLDTDLAFEYCTDIQAEILSSFDSVKNPLSGSIKAEGITTVIRDDPHVDPTKTRIQALGKDAAYHDL